MCFKVFSVAQEPKVCGQKTQQFQMFPNRFLGKITGDTIEVGWGCETLGYGGKNDF